MPMLEAKNATMQFGGLIAVNELNIEINEGENLHKILRFLVRKF